MWNRIESFGVDQKEIDKIAEELWKNEEKKEHCHDCGVGIDETHLWGCDVSRCTKCGGQELSCGCHTEWNHDKWDGLWPGSNECYEQKLVCCWEDTKEWQWDLNELARRRIL